jgi:L-seryl-tRNA(Ser) seleniumtransferase
VKSARWRRRGAGLVVAEARAVLEECRWLIQRGETLAEEPRAALERRLEEPLQPSLRRVINATGVILHTNLGRAPLPALAAPQGYSNLEYDLDAGRRGSAMCTRRRCSSACWARRASC